MKAFFVAVLIPLLVLVGCQGQVQRPNETDNLVVDFPGDPVTVVDIVRDAHAKEIEAKVLVGSSERYVTIMASKESPLPVGFSAELADGNGDLLASVEVAWDPGRPDRVWLKEQTRSDVLTASLRRVGDRMIETYDINGEAFVMDYAPLDPASKLHAANHFKNGESPRTEVPEARELVEKFKEFEAFYSQHAGNTLHNNPDGELLVTLINDEHFAGQAVGKDHPRPQKVLDRTSSRACAIAGICSLFKCMLGGWANFICISCGGVSLACSITVIGCWIAGCD